MPDFPYPYDSANIVPPPAWWPVLPRRGLLGAILAGIGLCFVVADISFCSSGSDFPRSVLRELWMDVNMGAVGAQASLLAIYAVLGPGRIWLRHVIALSLGMGCLLAWLLGYFLAASIYGSNVFPSSNVQVVYASMLVIPALFCGYCAPLWILRTLFRWRIELQLPGQTAAKPPQLSIAGILAATFAVAVALTLVRLGAYLSDFKEAEWWLGTGIATAFAAGICLFTLPFSTWAVLGARRFVVGIFLAQIWLCIVGFSLISLIRLLDGSWPPPPEIWVNFACVVASFMVFLLGPLIVCRFFPYRLIMGR